MAICIEYTNLFVVNPARDRSFQIAGTRGGLLFCSRGLLPTILQPGSDCIRLLYGFRSAGR